LKRKIRGHSQSLESGIGRLKVRYGSGRSKNEDSSLSSRREDGIKIE
jgi:hypothetical protein